MAGGARVVERLELAARGFRMAGEEVGAEGAVVERLVVEAITGPADGTDRSRSSLQPDALVVVTGAHDRTLPFPGWELPGVFTGGAAQA